MSLKKNKKSIIVILLLLVLAFIYAWIEPYWLEIKEVNIIDSDVPASFDGTKIVFLTDIHHGPFFSKDRVGRLVDQVNKLNPDLVLLGGDYVYKESKYIEPLFEELKHIKAPLGKFGVLGNHDHWVGADLTRKSAHQAKVTLLDNQAVWINKKDDRIKIGGVGDILEDTQDIIPTTKDVTEKDLVVLLSHNPDYAEEIKMLDIDLVLSGHTHGGQVTLFGLWAPLVPIQNKQKYRTGIVDTGYTTVLISNGVGTIPPTVRFFARPQVYLINLRASL